MKNDENKENKEKKITLKERLKDKRERAKIELMLYGIFFIAVIIFARIAGSSTPSNNEQNNQVTESFISSITDNYEYDMLINLNDNTYHYYGKVLGNNSTINLKIEDQITSYYLMNKKYYTLENGNYILTNEEEVYPYIDYYYLNINNIKEYIKLATKENDTYKVKISDIVLNSENDDYLIININEGDKNLVIDYTSLLKLTENNIEKAILNITYNNIDNIISLEE